MLATFLCINAQAQEKNKKRDVVPAEVSATLKQKVEEISKQAAALEAQKKPSEITALYLEALDKPEFQNVPERAILLLNLAEVWKSTILNPEKAQATFEEAAKLEPASRPHRIAALKGVGDSLLAQNKYELARKNYARIFEMPDVAPTERFQGRMLIAQAYEQEGNFPKAEAELMKAAQEREMKPVQRLEMMAQFYAKRKNWDAFKKTLEEIRKISKSVDGAVLLDYARLAQALEKNEEAEKAWDEVMAILDLPERLLTQAIDNKLLLLAARRDADALKKFVRSVSDRVKNAQQQVILALLAATLEVPKGDFSKFQAPDLESLDKEKQAQAYFDAGKLMMHFRDFEAARFLAQKGTSLLPKNPQRLYKVPFVKQAPRDVSDWLRSPFFQDPSRREDHFEKYNQQAAELLINDVNAARQVVTDATAQHAPLAFFMAADAKGWHVFIEYRDEKAEEVLAGLVPGGEIEIYMVPGLEAPYYFFILQVPSGKMSFMDWSSPNRHYRQANDKVASEVTPIPGGFGISLIFPWELIYDNLPQANGLWPFGIINFGREGAFTWGRGQVHELSRFGKVSFPDIEKHLPAIHRWIVLRAWAQYQVAAKNAALVWQDPEKGDPKFFETVVQPEIQRLNELGKLVSVEMSAADSEKLFRETVPTWMEFNYWVEEQRTRFLTDLFMAK